MSMRDAAMAGDEVEKLLKQAAEASQGNELVMQLYAARKAQGLSRARLAARAGLSKSTIARVEQEGIEWASLRTLRMLANALGLRLEVALQ